ncbi:LacI family DNA-binding transcriptional regulator [Microbacterium sp. CFBP9023]|uniref:LacI family DNA-binding transcriptional regulator n=1 Tax=Microbacterium TaxID=33882 RepID=UPI001DB514AA|nr:MULTISPECIES: LacI family DNA-binding transcriptional regulator [Microbacterium]MDY0985042.1 LacI family DNA-binding transcriptional regulator [Microbacterium sp. CFBP9023]CAH0179901.1 Catabolite control protein A [Microbacterium foliorum]CAH0203880.1 Catabolite control protein A [Microbacterium foliorum]
MAVQRKERRTTAADVAKSVGLSRATVGFVLNDTPGQTIPEVTRQRVLAEAKRLGYRPHTAARALASGRSQLVLLVLPDWPMDFSLRRNIEEASLALDEAGYALITYTPHPTGAARPLWEVLQPDVVMSLQPLTDEQIGGIRAADISRIVPNPATVAAEQRWVEEGPRLQITHLADEGHRQILFAGLRDPRLADLVESRFRSATEAANRLSLQPLRRADIDHLDPDIGDLVRSWREEGVTAVAGYNDDVAATVVGAALRAGMAVPQDLAVIGHDDTPTASMIHPQLSTIRVDTAGLGRYMAALALSAIDETAPPTAGPEFTATLIARASTVGQG